MKRDMDLIRQIMLQVESVDANALFGSTLPIDGYDPRTIAYHCVLLHEAGLIVADPVQTEFFDVQIYRLSWAGHEFLDASRNSKLWKSVTDKIKDKVATVSFEVLFSLLKSKAAAWIDGTESLGGL